MLRKFLNDPYYLLKYNATYALVLGAFGYFVSRSGLSPIANPLHFGITPAWLLALAVFMSPNFFVIIGGTFLIFALHLTMGPATPLSGGSIALLIAGSLYFAFLSAMLMHNAAHGNIRPRWLNRVVGELCGFHQLGGFPGWAIVHLVHHRFPDHPEKDPHPPGQMTFLEYMRTMFDALIRAICSLYEEHWGAKSLHYRRIWKLTGISAFLVRFLRVLILFALIGPDGFAYFFAPSYFFITLIYWHFNYATHRPGAEGMEIRDIHRGPYYRITNALFAGIYYHRTHHQRPYLFNPARAQSALAASPVIRPEDQLAEA